MGDDVSFGGSLYFSDGNGWKPVGEVSDGGVTLTAEDVAEPFPRALVRTESFEVRLSVPWERMNQHRRRMAYILGREYRPRYTVRRLRRGGKSHKGKEIPW